MEKEEKEEEKKRYVNRLWFKQTFTPDKLALSILTPLSCQLSKVKT